MTDTYSIFASIPYEGMHCVLSGTEEECKEWLKDKNRGYSFDDLEIYNNNAPDVYELFNSE